MKTYDPRQVLISVHIPKCAGTSFSNVLRLWFNRKFLLHYHDEKTNTPPRKHKLPEGSLKERAHYRFCIHGHFNNMRGNGVRDYYPWATQLITLIRHPFDLHLSTYFYVKREALSSGAGTFRAGKVHPIIENRWNLEAFLEHNKESYIKNFLPPEITPDNYETILASRFLYIGISEQLQQSVDILSGILGFPTVPVPRENASRWTEKIPDGAREEFEEINSLEMGIYNYALNHWGNRRL